MADPAPTLDLAAIEARQFAWTLRSDPARLEIADIIMEDIPALVARVRALEAEVAGLESVLTGERRRAEAATYAKHLTRSIGCAIRGGATTLADARQMARAEDPLLAVPGAGMATLGYLRGWLASPRIKRLPGKTLLRSFWA